MIALQEAWNSNSQQIFKTTQFYLYYNMYMCFMYCVYNFPFFFRLQSWIHPVKKRWKYNLFLFTAVYKILDSVTEILSTLKWKTLEVGEP